jgi:hypothetical protein
MFKELGVITLKGMFMPPPVNEKEKLTEKDADLKWLYFVCPTDERKHMHAIALTRNYVPGRVDPLNDKSAVWGYEDIGENKIAVSPSILSKDCFHIGIPTYFELVDEFDKLYEDRRKEKHEPAV